MLAGRSDLKINPCTIHQMNKNNIISSQSWKKRRRFIYINPSFITIAALSFLGFSHAMSQQTGCSCTPLNYKWVLNFTNPCQPSNLETKLNKGIEDIFCFVNSGDSVDVTPVKVTSYILIELRTNPEKVLRNETTLFDGDTIEFESLAATQKDFVAENFFAEVSGFNAAGERVDLGIFIEFTNICEAPPFQVGDSLGWLTLDDAEPFRIETCFPSLPFPPSLSPSSSPTNLPSLSPSSSPTRLPSLSPSSSPSRLPSFLPSTAPTPCTETKKSKLKCFKSKKSKDKSYKFKKSKRSKSKKLKKFREPKTKKAKSRTTKKQKAAKK